MADAGGKGAYPPPHLARYPREIEARLAEQGQERAGVNRIGARVAGPQPVERLLPGARRIHDERALAGRRAGKAARPAKPLGPRPGEGVVAAGIEDQPAHPRAAGRELGLDCVHGDGLGAQNRGLTRSEAGDVGGQQIVAPAKLHAMPRIIERHHIARADAAI